MGSGADGYPTGNGLRDAEQPAKALSDHIPQHPGNEDDCHGQAHIASQLLRNTHADGGGDGFGQQGHISGMIQPEQPGQKKNAPKTGQNPRENSQKHRFAVLFQQLKLLIQRHGQADRGGGQQVADVLRPSFVGGIVHPEQEQQPNSQKNRNKQRIQKGLFEFLLDPQASQVTANGQQCPEKGGIYKHLTHFSSPFSQETASLSPIPP